GEAYFLHEPLVGLDLLDRTRRGGIAEGGRTVAGARSDGGPDEFRLIFGLIDRAIEVRRRGCQLPEPGLPVHCHGVEVPPVGSALRYVEEAGLIEIRGIQRRRQRVRPRGGGEADPILRSAVEVPEWEAV